MPIPLIKFIRQHSAYSRRAILNHIVSGDVLVNKQLILDAQFLVEPSDVVTIKNQRITANERLYFIFHKPLDVISTMSDPNQRPCLGDYVRRWNLPDTLRPIGRLDRWSSGLLVFSNDGDFIQTLLHPSFAIKKDYAIKIDRPLTPAIKSQLSDGFFLPDGPVKLTFTQWVSDTEFVVSIHMGRNRILRRTFEFFDRTVVALHRIKIGELTLGTLPAGSFEPIDETTIKKLVLNPRNC